MDITILMPCLNEEETLAQCISKANKWINENPQWQTEVVVADNGSTDRSLEIAHSLGARVVNVPQKGMGAALYQGSLEALGKWIIMGDSDDSYDFSRISQFVEKLNQGYDLVVGNRFKGGIESGAMPFLNHYLGNPVLTLIGKALFSCPINDFHCGLRGIRKDAFLQLNIQSKGMEYYTEMAIRASLLNMKICEVPTKLSKDGRSRPPHLRPWSDGWRNLRFMLLYSPIYLFGIPATLSLILAVLFPNLSLTFIAGFEVASVCGLLVQTIGITQDRFPPSKIINSLIIHSELLAILSFFTLIIIFALSFLIDGAIIELALITVGVLFLTFTSLLFFTLPRNDKH